MAFPSTRLYCRIVLTAVFLCVSGLDAFRNKSHRTETFEKILNAYDAQLPPDYDSGTPVEVSVQIAVLSIDSIDETTMDYSMTIYLRQQWVDDRLRYEPFNVTHFVPIPKEQTSPGMESIAKVTEGKLELDTRAMNKVWVPDTFFYNERKGSFHDVTVPNRMLHIFSSGKVYYSIRLSLTLTCHMLLNKYPFDKQRCPLRLGSYGYSNEMLKYHWQEGEELLITNNMELPTFSISNWHTQDCNEEQSAGVYTQGVGNFSCLTLTVGLSRSYGFYIAQVYVPCILVVILSWVSFWLDIDAIPARISLGLLTVLTMTTMSVGSRSTLPRVSYLKALDVWNAMCLLFVFSALLEFAYVNVTTRVEKRRLSMRDAVNMATGKETCSAAKAVSVGRQRARLVDKVARVAFPSAFITFNIFYWCFYML